ncbi:MAG: hypothetical protein WCW31_03065 [Patescibacteria group bacterium]|jgi:hypothetical protein
MASDKPSTATPGQVQTTSGICQRIFPEGRIIQIDPSLREAMIVLEGYIAEEVEVVTDKGVGYCEAGNIEPGEAINELALFEISRDPDVKVRLRAKCRTVVAVLPIEKLQRLTQRMAPEDQRKLYEILGQMFRANAGRNSRLHRINAHNGLRATTEIAKRQALEAMLEQSKEDLDDALQKNIEAQADEARLNRDSKKHKDELDSALARERVLRNEVSDFKKRLKREKDQSSKTAQGLVDEVELLRKQLTEYSRWIEQNFPSSTAVRVGQAALTPEVLNAELDGMIESVFRPLVARAQSNVDVDKTFDENPSEATTKPSHTLIPPESGVPSSTQNPRAQDGWKKQQPINAPPTSQKQRPPPLPREEDDFAEVDDDELASIRPAPRLPLVHPANIGQPKISSTQPTEDLRTTKPQFSAFSLADLKKRAQIINRPGSVPQQQAKPIDQLDSVPPPPSSSAPLYRAPIQKGPFPVTRAIGVKALLEEENQRAVEQAKQRATTKDADPDDPLWADRDSMVHDQLDDWKKRK